MNASLPSQGFISLMMLQIGFSLPILLFSPMMNSKNTPEPQPSAENLLKITNETRKQYQLPPLSLDPRLVLTAEERGQDIIANNSFAHYISNQKTPWEWLETNQYRYESAAENLAINFEKPEAVIKAWLASPSHRENLLNPKLEDIGLAIIRYKKNNGNDSYLVVQIMAQPQKESLSTLLKKEQRTE